MVMWETFAVVVIVGTALFFSGRSLLRGVGSNSRSGCSGCSGCASQPCGDGTVKPDKQVGQSEGSAA